MLKDKLVEALAKIEQEKGYSQAHVAKMAGIKPPYLSLLARGERTNPSPDILFRLSQVLGVNLIEDSSGKRANKSCAVIGISGPSCSGKSWLASKFADCRDDVLIVDLDGYYKEPADIEKLKFRHDNPEALRLEDLCVDLGMLIAGQAVEVPVWDFETHLPKRSRLCTPKPIIVVEGLFLFTNKSLRKRMDVKIWMDASETTRLMRRINRDTKERGRSIEEIKTRYEQDVIPAYEQHIAPFRQEADVVISNDYDDRDSIPLIVQMVLAYVDRLRMFGS